MSSTEEEKDSVSINGELVRCKRQNFESAISGFYYDEQLKNPLTTITLHANQRYKPKPETGEDQRKNLDDYWEDYPEDERDSQGYGKEAIASAILSQDFNVDIATNWQNFGADPINSMWTQQQSFAPYADYFSSALKEIADKTDSWMASESGEHSKVSNFVANGMGTVAGFFQKGMDRNKEYLYRGLHVQGTKFAYFGGTGVSFDSFSMEFTILATHINGKWLTVYDQLQKIMPYFIGDFVPVNIGDKVVGSTIQEFLQDFAAWEMPPGGFRPDLVNQDTDRAFNNKPKKGTMKLRIGSYFSMTNLVISSCQLSFSKTMVKNPESSDVFETGQDYSPYSCQVKLSFKSGIQYSINSLRAAISGENTRDVRDNVNKKMAAQLKQLKTIDNKDDLKNILNIENGDTDDMEISPASTSDSKLKSAVKKEKDRPVGC